MIESSFKPTLDTTWLNPPVVQGELVRLDRPVVHYVPERSFMRSLMPSVPPLAREVATVMARGMVKVLAVLSVLGAVFAGVAWVVSWVAHVIYRWWQNLWTFTPEVAAAPGAEAAHHTGGGWGLLILIGVAVLLLCGGAKCVGIHCPGCG